MKLKKKQIEALEEIEKRRATAFAEIETAVEKANEEISKAHGPVEAAINKYNEILSEFNENIRAEIQSEIEDYVSDRSDKWHESDAADSVQAYLDAWGEELEDIALPEEPSIEVEFGDHGEDECITGEKYPQESDS